MPKDKNKENDSPREDAGRHPLPRDLPYRRTQRLSSPAAGPAEDGASTRRPRQGKRNASASSTTKDDANANPAKSAKHQAKPPENDTSPANQGTRPSSSRIHLNTGDVSSWSPEMHRQYRLIQTPMVLLEKMYERPILPAGFHTPPQSSPPTLEEEEGRARSTATQDASISEGIGAWAEEYEGVRSGDSAAESAMFNVDLDLEVYLDRFPEEQQHELLRMALARKKEREEADEVGPKAEGSTRAEKSGKAKSGGDKKSDANRRNDKSKDDKSRDEARRDGKRKDKGGGNGKGKGKAPAT